MGGVIESLVFKSGKETVTSKHKSAFELIGATNIDGEEIDPLLTVVEGKKCVMIVNVATR